MLRQVLAAALLAVAIAADPPHSFVDGRRSLSQQCAGYCKDSSKFTLQSGSTYVYSYEGTTKSVVEGTSNDTSEIKITAKAHMYVTDSPCELILQVQNVQLLDSAAGGLEVARRQREFSAGLSQNALRFSLQDGRVDQLCPAADEPTWALNFKRGLLSVFQNSMVDFKDSHLLERDVSGACDTVYSVRDSIFGRLKVLRHKNLNSCSGGNHQTLGLPTAFRSTPIIKSEQVCEQMISTDERSQHLSFAGCRETHVFVPFSNGQSGIRTSVMASLDLDEIIQTSEPIVTDLFVNKRTNLQYDFSAAAPDSAVTTDDVWATLGQLMASMQHGVTTATTLLFDQLVRQMTTLDDQQLVKLFDEQREQKSRQWLLNALPLLGSAASVRAMYQIHAAQEVSREEVDSWLTTLAFHKTPTPDMLHTLNMFVQEGFHPKAWLAVSSVVHTYCQHDRLCRDTLDVQQIMARLEGALGSNCHSASPEQQQAVIVALKAIGNVGFIGTINTLEKCFMNDRIPMTVRLAAVSATRRFDCGSLEQWDLLRVFSDRSQDTELRIAAYLAALQCPTTAKLSTVVDSLYQEDVNQVLSFVWTHLTNLQESTSSWKKEIRQMLQDNYLAQKFKTDARKFSRNYEMSYYSDILNTRATADSNVIFSSKSYLPRSASLNLTLDIFGEPVNIFEFGTRLEGFESIVEDIFSPRGYFPDESMEKLLKNMRSSDDEKNQVIQTFSDRFTQETIREPQGIIFTRVFGNELYLSQFNSLSTILDLNKSNTLTLNGVLDSLKTLLSKKIDYTKSFQLINSKFVIPTIVGLPLRLEINGSATVGMQLNTEIDLANILKTKTGNVALFVNPSVAVEIDGKMTIDAVFTKAGVETKGTLSSNTYFDTKVTIDRGQVVDVFVNTPRDKMEIINVTSAVYVKRQNELVEVEGIGEIYERDTCSGTHVPTITGVRGCSQMIVRNASAIQDSPYFPLTGRFQYALALRKSDNINSYQLHLRRQLTSSSGGYIGSYKLEFDTPGSSVNRKILASLEFDSIMKRALFELSSPASNFEFLGKLDFSDADKSLAVMTRIDGSDYAGLKMALQMANSPRTIRYEPSFSMYAYPNFDLNVTGFLSIVPGSKYSTEFTAVGLTKKPIFFSGELSGMKGRYSAALFAKAEGLDVKVNGKIVSTPSATSVKTMARYALGSAPLHSVDVSAKLQNHKKGGFTKKHLSANIQMSQLPSYSSKLAWTLYRTQNYLDSNADLTVGKTQWKSKQVYHNNMHEKDKNFEVVLSLESPTKKMDYRAEVQYKTTDATIHGHTLAQLSNDKRFISRLDYEQKLDQVNPSHSLELELASPWKRAALAAKLETVPPPDWEWTRIVNGSVRIEWGDIAKPHWTSAEANYRAAESLLSARHLVAGRMESSAWAAPAHVEAEWAARSDDGLILSDSWVTLKQDLHSYRVAVAYVKDPSVGQHDLKVNLDLPHKTYSSSFLMVNNLDIKNVTVQLDLEKTLYFSTEIEPWKVFEAELFWDYLGNRHDCVLLRYQTNPGAQVAMISMPGHYASLTVDKLGPGLSSMNITAMWGESEDSASAAILLSTYWQLDLSWQPSVRARATLTTPFIGFQHQSFSLSFNQTADSATALTAADFDLAAKWQDQFIDFKFSTENKLADEINDNNQIEESGVLSASIQSTLEFVKNARVKANYINRKEPYPVFSTVERIYGVNASYNEWTEFVSYSSYSPNQLSVKMVLNEKKNNKLLSFANLLIENNNVDLGTMWEDNKISFTSSYNLPNTFNAKLTTPFKGYEESFLDYKINFEQRNLKALFSGKLGSEFLLLSGNLTKSQSGFHCDIDLSSSSYLPDLTILLQHELHKSQHSRNSLVKEHIFVSLSKNGKQIQSSQAFLSLTDEFTSVSSHTKSIKTVLQLPDHFLSSNYTFQKQIKLSGVEISHQLVHLWNDDQIEASLTHEGVTVINGLLTRNNERKIELLVKQYGNGNVRTDLALAGGYSFKHRLFVEDLTIWDNFISVSSPSSKLIIKSAQSLNSAGTSFNHKTSISVNKDVANIDLLVSLDSDTRYAENVLFSIATPWTYPILAKYDLLVNTGASTKHEIQLKYKKNQEIKSYFDITSTTYKKSASFQIHSPYCKHLEGKYALELEEALLKSNAQIKMDENIVATDLEIIRSLKSPHVSFSIKNAFENIVHITGNYNLDSVKKEFKLLASYLNKDLLMQGHYSSKDGKINAGSKIITPFEGWNQLTSNFNSVLSQQNSMFALEAKKDNKFITISGTGSFSSSLIKTSLSLDYLLDKIIQKHSTVFECSSGFVSLECKKNEVNYLEFFLKSLRSITKENKYIYSLKYKALLPIEKFKDSALDITMSCDNVKQIVNGKVIINDWERSVKGENTFDSNGFGYLDVRIFGSGHIVGAFLKHANDENDAYVWNLSNNEQFMNGRIDILQTVEKVNLQYVVESSVDKMEKVSGAIIVDLSPDVFKLESMTNINDENYILGYNGSTSLSSAKHYLWISIPVKGFENIEGVLEYNYNGSQLMYLEGKINNGNTKNMIAYIQGEGSGLFDFKIDCPALFTLLVSNIQAHSLIILRTLEDDLSQQNILMSFYQNKTFTTLEMDNSYTGFIEFTNEIGLKNRSTLISSYLRTSRLTGSLTTEVNNAFISFDLKSNIPKWTKVVLLYSFNEKCALTISKENEEIFTSSVEGYYNQTNGDVTVSVLLRDFFMDANLRYETASNFSAELKYNINGNKQHLDFEMSFSPDDSRIDLATPIKGIEDLTVIGNINKKFKKVAFVLKNKESALSLDLSAKFEGSLVILKSNMYIGGDQYTLSIGAQNGTDEDPKWVTGYISAAKNNNVAFWLSIEGSYNLEKKAGVQVSFSSYYYKQLYLEVLSYNEFNKHTYVFSYLYGADVSYFLKTTITGNSSRAELVIESRLGPNNHYLNTSFDLLSSKKSAAFNLKKDEDKLISITGEALFSLSTSNIEFTLKNENFLAFVDSVRVFGDFSFQDKSKMRASLDLNELKYFDLFVESSSLYSVAFHSTLLPSALINSSYDISLNYEVSLPEAHIDSIIYLNGDHYMCNGNLTWDDELAKTFFQLSTNAGYGFENVTLTAQYSIVDYLRFSHFVDFTVDDSKLFLIASEYYYPNQLHFNLILPDSLFLPLLKQIDFEFNCTETMKKVSFIYLSSSTKLKVLKLQVKMKADESSIELIRDELNEEGTTQSDTFSYSYSATEEQSLVSTSLKFESKEILSIEYADKRPTDYGKSSMTLLETLFGLTDVYSLSVKAGFESVFRFSGAISPNEVSLTIKHPLTVFHEEISLSEYLNTKKINEWEFFRSFYKRGDNIQYEIKYSDYLATELNYQSNGIVYTTFTDTYVISDEKTVAVNAQETCEHYLMLSSSKPMCMKLKHMVKVTGLLENPMTMTSYFDVAAKRFGGLITTAYTNYTYEAVASINHNQYICSNFNLFLKTARSPEDPLAIKYETNCRNYFHVSMNIFNNKTHEIKTSLDDPVNPSQLQMYGSHIFFKNWNIIISKLISDNTMSLRAYFDEEFLQVHLKKTENHCSFKIESSKDVMKHLELSSETKDLNSFGKFKLEGSKESMEWLYNVKYASSGLVCNITSNKDIRLDVVIHNNEIVTQLKMKGKLYKGNAAIINSVNDPKIIGSATFSIDGEEYKLSFEHYRVSLDYIMSSVMLDSPVDNYYVYFYFNKTADFKSPMMWFKYRTPLHVLDFADVRVRFSKAFVDTTYLFPLKNIETNQEEHMFDLSNCEYNVVLSLNTTVVNFEDAEIKIRHGSNNFEATAKYLSHKISVAASLLENHFSYAGNAHLITQDLSHPYLRFFEGDNQVKLYFNKQMKYALVSIQTNLMKNIITFTSQSKDYFSSDDESMGMKVGQNSTAQITYGQTTLFSLHTSRKVNGFNEQFIGKLFGHLDSNKTVDADFFMSDDNIRFESKIWQETTMQTETRFLFIKEKSEFAWGQFLDLHINNLATSQVFNSQVLMKQEKNHASGNSYTVHFSNGFQNRDGFLGVNCSLNSIELKTISSGANQLINSEVIIDTLSKQYVAIPTITIGKNKMDASVKWTRILKSEEPKQIPDFSFVNFGGLIDQNSAILYLNDNKFICKLDRSPTQTSFSANLVNEQIHKNITVLASVQYSPIYVFNISHNMFDSPCSIEVKVDRRSQSIETAVTIMYNRLKQQAFMNVYLDGTPRYAELVYYDIWQQTHEASVYVEESEDEVTMRCKINSPALDENFMIVTVGNNNNKIDFNLNDAFILRVFKDRNTGLLNLILFGHDLKLDYSYTNEMKVTVSSPAVNGFIVYGKTVGKGSFLEVILDAQSYHLLLGINQESVFNAILSKENKNIFDSKIEIQKDSGSFLIKIDCDILDNQNSLIAKQEYIPFELVISLDSNLLKNNLEIRLGLENNEIMKGMFVIKQEAATSLFESYLVLNKVNKSIELILEAPLFSEMDRVKVDGILNVQNNRILSDCELRLNGILTSENALIAQGSIFFVKNEEIFNSGVIFDSDLSNFDHVVISLMLPNALFSQPELKAKLLVQLPSIQPTEIVISFCKQDSSKIRSEVISASFKWPGFLASMELKGGNSPFYSEFYELSANYQEKKLQIGAWMKPKDPLTDFIYFIDTNDERLIEISHALIVKPNHFKTKIAIQSAFKGHEKYGVDLEMQNLKVGKAFRVLGSVPQLGKDLGIDFGYTFESILDYAMLAQIKIPYKSAIKMVRLYSIQKININQRFIKINHSLDCSGFTQIGWEFEMYGSTPWRSDVSSLETKLTFSDQIYSVKTKTFIHSNKTQIFIGVETPFDCLRKGLLQMSGTKQLVGSDLSLSMNSNEIINVNITEDISKTKQIQVLSRWRSFVVRYMFNVDGTNSANAYVCWDLANKNSSQIGLSFKSGWMEDKYENTLDLILPSTLIPKLGVKQTYKLLDDNVFVLFEVSLPGLVIGGKMATESSNNVLKSGAQLMWEINENAPKNIGIFYVKDINNDEIKHYLTFQHFALQSDIMVILYSKDTVYGLNLQYSELKEEEITIESGYWMIEEEDKRRSGFKLVALHPATNTLIYTIANLTSSDLFSEAGLSVSYQIDSDSKKVKNVELYGKKNEKIPEIYFRVVSNGDILAVGGSMWNRGNLQGIHIETQVNQKDPLKLELVHNTENPGVDAELSYSLSRTYRMFAGMPNDNELTAKLSHSMYGRDHLDAVASLRLNTSRTLWGRFEQLPSLSQVGQEFYDGILEEFNDLRLVSEAISCGFSDFLQEDSSKKITLLLNSITATTDNLISQTYAEMSVLSTAFESVGQIACQAYAEDHFYLKTMHNYLNIVKTKVFNQVACAFDLMAGVFKTILTPIQEVFIRVWGVIKPLPLAVQMVVKDLSMGESPIQQISRLVISYQQMRHGMITHARRAIATAKAQLVQAERESVEMLSRAELWLNKCLHSMEHELNQQFRRVIDYKNTILAGFYILSETVEGMIEIVQEGVYRIKEVRATVEWAVKCVDAVNIWLTSFRLETYLKDIDNFAGKVFKLVAVDFEKHFGEYEVYLLKGKAFLEGHYDEINKIPQVQYVRNLANHVYQKLNWFWKYANLNEKLKAIVVKYLEDVKTTLDELDDQLDREDRELMSEYSYNDENRSLTFTQELPFEWRAFNRMPEYNADANSNLLRMPAKEYTVMVQTMAQYLWQDAKLLPLLVPSFSSDALITRDGLVTFDNVFYTFGGDCNSYLLAADLYHLSFSLVANYTRQNKRDTTLSSEGVDITIKDNLEVFVNGKLIELPQTLGNGKLTLTREIHSVLVKSKQGFSLECSSFQDICRFHLDGWYMGKTAGLLGTYNNEPSDDFIDPSRKLSENIKQFTDSWALDSSSCESDDDLSTSSEDAKPLDSVCEQFFTSQSSPFFPCFSIVDPQAFYRMCATKQRQENTCASVYAYLTKCSASGVKLWMPEFCADSSLVNATILTGYSDLTEVPSQSTADVVFVVESSDCAIPLQTLVSSLASELKLKGITDNRFAFISFGHDARIQTVEGQIWTGDDKLISNVQTRLIFEKTSEEAYGSALELAASLPFRAGASKTVVLVHCSTCPHDRSYSALLERFKHADITLHVIQRDQLLSRGRGRVVSKAVGVEKAGAYPRKRLSKNTDPDVQLLQQVVVPQDMCSPVALGTNGTVFSGEVSRKWQRVWASRVAHGAAPASGWQQCENTVGADNVPVWLCRRAPLVNKLKEWNQPALDEYMDTSRASDYIEYEEIDV